MARALGPVTAVVVNYEGEDYLEECLRSILALEGGVDELIVVDNGSTDGSVELLRRRFAVDVKLLTMLENKGPCAARNAGMRAARNRFVLAIDNDAVLEPDLLVKLRAALEADDAAVAAQPRSVYYDEPSRVHYDGAEFHYVGLYALRNFALPLGEAAGEGTVEANGLIGITILLDRDAVLAAGGYDEALFALAEDYDLALRLRVAGARLLSVEDALVRHRGGTPGMSFRGARYPERRAYLHAKNRWIIVGKSYAARTLLVALPALVVYELVWAVFALGQGHLGATLRGKLDFLREELAPTRAKRARVQAARRVRDRELLVGGPLTFSPQLVAKPFARRLAGALSACFRGWWTVVRWAAG